VKKYRPARAARSRFVPSREATTAGRNQRTSYAIFFGGFADWRFEANNHGSMSRIWTEKPAAAVAAERRITTPVRR
jgi:hypothetical protein